MAINPTGSANQSRQARNILLTGVAIGAIGFWILSAVFGGGSDTKSQFDQVNERLDAIEEKLDATPVPQASATPSGPSVSQINKNPSQFTGQTVTLTGKVQSPTEGVGFLLVDGDGTYLWVHTKSKIPTGTATVKGKVEELKDQLSQWKNEPGWPDNDTALTGKLREEKIFIEAESVS